MGAREGLAAGLAVGAGVGALALAQLRRRYLVVRVDGTSMWPTYWPGERLLAARLDPDDRLSVGDVVVLDHDGRRALKRVSALADDVPEGFDRALTRDEVWVVGEQAGSIDSRVYGPLQRSELVARVVRRLSSGERDSVLGPDGADLPLPESS